MPLRMIPLGHLPFFGGKPLLPPPSLCFELTRNNFIFVAELTDNHRDSSLQTILRQF